MKLSEHMRLGALSGPQIKGQLFNEYGGSCALGSVMYSSGVAHNVHELRAKGWGKMPHDELRELFPILDRWPGFLPDGITRGYVADKTFLGETRNMTLWELIVVLNNKLGWTREVIADYVEQLESLEAAKAGEATLSLEISPLEIMQLCDPQVPIYEEELETIA